MLRFACDDQRLRKIVAKTQQHGGHVHRDAFLLHDVAPQCKMDDSGHVIS